MEERKFEDIVFVSVCRCGAAATCEYNWSVDVCDVANNVCKCGSMDPCISSQMCVDGACVVGN